MREDNEARGGAKKESGHARREQTVKAQAYHVTEHDRAQEKNQHEKSRADQPHVIPLLFRAGYARGHQLGGAHRREHEQVIQIRIEGRLLKKSRPQTVEMPHRHFIAVPIFHPAPADAAETEKRSREQNRDQPRIELARDFPPTLSGAVPHHLQERA